MKKKRQDSFEELNKKLDQLLRLEKNQLKKETSVENLERKQIKELSEIESIEKQIKSSV